MDTQQLGTEPDGLEPQNEDRRRRTKRNVALGVLAVALLGGAVFFGISTTNDETEVADELPSASVASPQPAVERLPDGDLEPGRYVFGSSFDFTLDSGLGDHQISIDVPDGYEGVFGIAALKSGMTETGVSTLAVGTIYADACQWSGAPVAGISSTDDVVSALAGQEGLRVTDPSDAEVDGFAARYMERTVPTDTRLSDCDGREFRVYQDRNGGNRFLNPGQLDLLWIVDVDGVPLVIDASLEHGASAATRAEVERMVKSLRIDPEQEG